MSSDDNVNIIPDEKPFVKAFLKFCKMQCIKYICRGRKCHMQENCSTVRLYLSALCCGTSVRRFGAYQQRATSGEGESAICRKTAQRSGFTDLPSVAAGPCAALWSINDLPHQAREKVPYARKPLNGQALCLPLSGCRRRWCFIARLNYLR